MNSFWETLDSLSGTIGGVLSSQYGAKTAQANAATAAALAKAQADAAAGKSSTNWTKIALIGGGVVAALALVLVFTRK